MARQTQFLDMTRREEVPLRTRLARSPLFWTALATIFLSLVGWFIWYTTIRLDVPTYISQAHRQMDTAYTARDAKAFLNFFSPEVELNVGGKDMELAAFAKQTRRVLMAKRFASVSQTTKLSSVHQKSQDRTEVTGTIVQELVLKEGQPKTHRMKFKALWRRAAVGWTLERFNSELVRERS